MKKRTLSAIAAVTAAGAALALAGCSASSPAPAPTTAGPEDITFWLMGGDTPQELRDYLVSEYKKENGGTLTIEQQDWSDALSKLQTQLPDSKNTPDVTEIGNTWSSTFTSVGAFSDVTDLVPALGGSDLLPSFVDIGEYDGKNYALPYYFGSRYVFYRKDIWSAAGITEAPKTLADFDAAVKKLTTSDLSGFWLGGSDWRDGISWVFANGGDLAKQGSDGKWQSTLSDPATIKGLTELQSLYTGASHAPVTDLDSNQYTYVNDGESGKPEAATAMAPGWAHWSIGDLSPDPKDATKTVATWNDDKDGVFVLPGVSGGVAPVFAGGSNIAISAASTHQAGARDLLKIIFGADYQNMLGKNGLGPANLKYTASLGDDQFAKALAESAAGSKLTPAAPGWGAVEGSGLLEEFFSKVNGGGDVTSLAAEYDQKIDALING